MVVHYGEALKPLRDAWREKLGRAPPDSAVHRMKRGQAQVTLFAVGLWLLGIAPAVIASQNLAVQSWGALCLVVLVVTAVRLPTEPYVLMVTLTASAAGVVFATGGLAAVGQSPMAAAWFDTAALAVGLGLMTLRRGVLGALILAAIALVCWTLQAQHLPGGWHTALAWPIATTGLGLAATMAAAVVRRGAVRLDGMAASAQAAATDEELAEVARDEFFRTSRVLHDTVINTLSAISRGVPSGRREELRARCRQDLRLMDEAAPTTGDWEAVDPVTVATERSIALGVQLSVTGGAAVLAGVSARVLDALSAAVSEALLNVSKHAQVDAAELVIERVSDAQAIVRVIDQGRGIVAAPSREGGISQSIRERCRREGITAHIRPAAGDRGTVVELLVPIPLGGWEKGATVFRRETRLIAAAGAAAIVLEVSLRTLLSFGVIADASAIPLAALILATAFAFVASRDRTRPPFAASLLLALVGLPVMYFLPIDATGPLAWGWWGTIAGLEILLALLMLNASAWWIMLAYLAQVLGRYLAQEGSQVSLVFPASVIIAIGAATIVLIRRRMFSVVTEYDELTRQRDRGRRRALAMTASRMEGMQQLAGAIALARVPLQEVADGRATGEEPELQADSAQLAAYLRNVSRVDPDLGVLAVPLLRLLSAGRDINATITLAIDPNIELPATGAKAVLSEFLGLCASRLAPGAEMSVSVLGRASRGALSVVAGTPCAISPHDVAAFAREGVAVEWSQLDADTWVELAWGSGSAGLEPRS